MDFSQPPSSSFLFCSLLNFSCSFFAAAVAACTDRLYTLSPCEYTPRKMYALDTQFEPKKREWKKMTIKVRPAPPAAVQKKVRQDKQESEQEEEKERTENELRICWRCCVCVCQLFLFFFCVWYSSFAICWRLTFVPLSCARGAAFRFGSRSLSGEGGVWDRKAHTGSFYSSSSQTFLLFLLFIILFLFSLLYHFMQIHSFFVALLFGREKWI